METHDLKSILRQHPFLKDGGEDYLNLIAGCAKNQIYEANQTLFKTKEKADTFYILREGQIALSIPHPHHAIAIQTLHAGDVLGWSWFVEPYRWHFDAKAIEKTRLICFDAKCLRKKMEQNHDFGYLLLKKFIPVLVDRLQATRMQLLDFYKEPATRTNVWQPQ